MVQNYTVNLEFFGIILLLSYLMIDIFTIRIDSTDFNGSDYIGWER